MELLGGLGLFLLGMVVMTDGLRALAGDVLRRWLTRFTRTPLTGALSGAACTAILQSSSATTVAVVGFVAAHLMSFPAALGIIFGANLGTTITGWMVAVIGFKLKLTLLAWPLVFAGVLVRLFARGKLASLGMAIAGFALIFIGVAAMQDAMLGLRDVFAFDRIPGDTYTGRALLLLVGVAFTVVAQSSSAGVAATLTALNTGVVDFPQAAALIVGMDVGTSVTALLATVGSSANARRTGLSHVVYNIMTGATAWSLIPVYIAALNYFSPSILSTSGEVALVAFHSLFNALAVLAVLPLTYRFAAMMERLIPGHSPTLTDALDPSLLSQPAHALDAVQATIKQELVELMRVVKSILMRSDRPVSAHLDELQSALEDTRAYLDQIHLESDAGAEWHRLLATIHALDHAQRLYERCRAGVRIDLLSSSKQHFGAQHKALEDGIDVVLQEFDAGSRAGAAGAAQLFAAQIDDSDDLVRDRVMCEIALGNIDVPEGTRLLDANRWIQRVSRHIERATAHLGGA